VGQVRRDQGRAAGDPHPLGRLNAPDGEAKRLFDKALDASILTPRARNKKVAPASSARLWAIHCEEEDTMGFISWIILGLIAGFIGSKIVNKRGEGLLLDIVLGILGAIVGGFLFSLIGAVGVTGLNLYSMMVATVGAVVVLLIYHALFAGRSG
jgi:uncharacterized membrane protein YeaQ/YmgE (transglycosylase-associated protein family)